MKTDLFQSCGHCWVFHICWHIEYSTFTASSFRIWNSSTEISSPPLASFIVMLPKAHLTLNSRMSGSRWVITPSWLSGPLRFFFFFCIVLLCILATSSYDASFLMLFGMAKHIFPLQYSFLKGRYNKHLHDILSQKSKRNLKINKFRSEHWFFYLKCFFTDISHFKKLPPSIHSHRQACTHTHIQFLKLKCEDVC